MTRVGGMNLMPESLRGYQPAWLTRDIIAGLTLAAVAIPEVMGYTTIAGTPIVTGLYTIIFPTLVFALLGSSRLLVVGADSATAAVLAAGMTGLGIAGVTPGSADWLALTSLTALVCGVLLIVARLLRLGFIGDFLSASVLIGFLTGVGIQVLSGQIPDLLGIPKGKGGWFEQQWHWIASLSSVELGTVSFGLSTIVIIQLFKRFLPVVPGAIVAVILLTAISALTDAHTHGTAVVVGVEQGIILAVLLSLLDLVRRQYTPGDYVIGQDRAGEPMYQPAEPGAQSLPGLVVFRYDAELFYANANRFADDLEAVISAAPDPVRWVVLDCGAIDDIDYSAGVTLTSLVKYCQAHNARFVLVRPDTQLLATLRAYQTLDAIGEDNIFPT
jgi:MFS superfamily sulfate permease-like transporter